MSGAVSENERAFAPLESLLDFLDRAQDVLVVEQNFRDGVLTIPVHRGEAEVVPTAIVTTTRHRVWVVHLPEDNTDGRLRRKLAEWCRRRTLDDEAGRTFRSLVLDGDAFPVDASVTSFEDFAASNHDLGRVSVAGHRAE